MAKYDHFHKKTEFQFSKWLAENWLKKIAKSIHKSNRILEVGPGKGVLSNYFPFENYIAIEPNFNLAKDLSTTKQVIQAGLPKTPFQKDTFSSILLIHVFEHLGPYNFASKSLSEFHSILEPTGELIILSPDITDFKEIFWDCDSTHNLPTSLRNTQQMLEDNNFKVVSYKYHFGNISSKWGIIPNILTKSALFLLNPIENLFPQKTSKIRKLKTLFARSFEIRAEKQI
jgi:SAM-dependent methyltransferase